MRSLFRARATRRAGLVGGELHGPEVVPRRATGEWAYGNLGPRIAVEIPRHRGHDPIVERTAVEIGLHRVPGDRTQVAPAAGRRVEVHRPEVVLRRAMGEWGYGNLGPPIAVEIPRRREQGPIVESAAVEIGLHPVSGDRTQVAPAAGRRLEVHDPEVVPRRALDVRGDGNLGPPIAVEIPRHRETP